MSSSTNATGARGHIRPSDTYITVSRPMLIQALATFTRTLAPAEIPQGEDCSICLESLALDSGSPQEQAPVAQDKTVVRPLVCRHAAHYGCLLSWTEQRSNCPLCRRGLFYRRVSPRNRDSLRKFIVPFASGGFAISENLWTEWVNACGSDEEFSWVMGFHEFIDEEACWRFVRGE